MSINIVSETVEYIKAHGLLSFFKIVVKRFIFCHERLILIFLSLEEPFPEIRVLNNITFRKATLNDVEELHQY